MYLVIYDFKNQIVNNLYNLSWLSVEGGNSSHMISNTSTSNTTVQYLVLVILVLDTAL